MAFVIVCRMANETHAYTRLQKMFGEKSIGSFVIHHPRFGEFLGSQEDAIFLEVLIGWDGKQWDPDGWIKKSSEEMTLESGLSKYQQEQVIKRLMSLGYIEKKLKGIPATNHFKIIYPAIQARWPGWLKTHPPPEKKRRKVRREPEPQLAGNQSTTTYATHEYTHSPTESDKNLSEPNHETSKNGPEFIGTIIMKQTRDETIRRIRERNEREEAAKNISNNPTLSIPSGDNPTISGTS
ncbi:hypothetical protein KBC54_04140 [Patescibacteria group bacterium]|nr:hypothetical protein [Patescibacteria group bacterium]